MDEKSTATESYFASMVRHVHDTVSETGEDYCLSLESRTGPPHWIQIAGFCVNLAYPLSGDPNIELGIRDVQKPEEFELVEWRANEFATFETGVDDAKKIAAFIRTYAERILGLRDEASDYRCDAFPM